MSSEPSPSPPTAICLTIKNLTKRDFTLGEVPLALTVGELKARIESEYEGNPPPNTQRIVYAGALLRDESAGLADVVKASDLEAGAVVFHLVLPAEASSTASTPASTPGATPASAREPGAETSTPSSAPSPADGRLPAQPGTPPPAPRRQQSAYPPQPEATPARFSNQPPPATPTRIARPTTPGMTPTVAAYPPPRGPARALAARAGRLRVRVRRRVQLAEPRRSPAPGAPVAVPVPVPVFGFGGGWGAPGWGAPRVERSPGRVPAARCAGATAAPRGARAGATAADDADAASIRPERSRPGGAGGGAGGSRRRSGGRRRGSRGGGGGGRPVHVMQIHIDLRLIMKLAMIVGGGVSGRYKREDGDLRGDGCRRVPVPDGRGGVVIRRFLPDILDEQADGMVGGMGAVGGGGAGRAGGARRRPRRGVDRRRDLEQTLCSPACATGCPGAGSGRSRFWCAVFWRRSCPAGSRRSCTGIPDPGLPPPGQSAHIRIEKLSLLQLC